MVNTDELGVSLKRVWRGAVSGWMRAAFPLMRSCEDIVSNLFPLLCVGCRRRR